MSSKNGKFMVFAVTSDYENSYRLDTFKEAEAHAKELTYKHGAPYAVFAMIAKAKHPVAVSSIEMEKIEVVKV